jgi:hypothetical protein
MSSKQDIITAIRQIANIGDEVYSIVCKVKQGSVDLNEKTCICVPINGDAEIWDVKLMAKNQTGLFIIPKDNSDVIVTMTNKTSGYVAMFSELEEIQLNGDNEDGLVKINDLVTKLNNLESAFNQHILLYNAHIHSGGTISGSTAVPAVVDTQSLTPTIKNDLENTKVKHGS